MSPFDNKDKSKILIFTKKQPVFFSEVLFSKRICFVCSQIYFSSFKCFDNNTAILGGKYNCM